MDRACRGPRLLRVNSHLGCGLVWRCRLGQFEQAEAELLKHAGIVDRCWTSWREFGRAARRPNLPRGEQVCLEWEGPTQALPRRFVQRLILRQPSVVSFGLRRIFYALGLGVGASSRRAILDAAIFQFAATPRIAKMISGKSDMVSRNDSASDRMPAPAAMSRAMLRRSVVSRDSRSTAGTIITSPCPRAATSFLSRGRSAVVRRTYASSRKQRRTLHHWRTSTTHSLRYSEGKVSNWGSVASLAGIKLMHMIRKASAVGER